MFAVEWLIILLHTTEASVSNFGIMAEVFRSFVELFHPGCHCRWQNYWLDGSVFNFRQGQGIFLLSKTPAPALGPALTRTKWT